MTFQLDTSGDVQILPAQSVGGLSPARCLRWEHLDPFTQGYIEALLRDLWWTVAKPGAYHALAPETLARIIEDCDTARHAEIGTDDRKGGRKFFALRQTGASGHFPPLSVALRDDGKVVFA